VFALVVLATFTVWITWRAKAIELAGRWSQAPSALIGKPAPDFDLQSLDGRKVSLADYRDRTLAVTFWASWCAPCRMELPVLTKFYQQTHNDGSSFEILVSASTPPRTQRGTPPALWTFRSRYY
jgi:hypothetical protein